MRKVLDDKTVAAAKCPAGKAQDDHFDVLCPGLSLRVTAMGKKVWNFVFTSPRDGKTGRMKIGTYPALSLKAARTKASEMKEHIDNGRDPRAVILDRRMEKTVKELIEDRLKFEVRGKLRSADEIERRFNADIIPVVGDVLVKEFKITHLNRVIDPIQERGCARLAGLVAQDLKKLFTFAVQRGEVEYSPIDKAKVATGLITKDRVLSLKEIHTLWNRSPEILDEPHIVEKILMLVLALGQRPGEVAGMRRDEIDGRKKIWTIPASRSKNGYEHLVPINAVAWEIIADRLRHTNGDFLFPREDGQDGYDVRVVDYSVRRRMAEFNKAEISKFTPHDLRRTMATHMSRQENGLSIPQLIIGHVLNHRSTTHATVTQIVYDRNNYLDEKRDALDKWSAFLSDVIAGRKLDAGNKKRAA